MIERNFLRCTFRCAALAGLALASSLFCFGAHAESFDNTFARDFVTAWSREDWNEIGFAIAPDEQDRIRKLVLAAIETEAKDGTRDIRSRLFGAGVSVDDLRRMTPQVLMMTLAKRFMTAPRPVLKTEVIGMVKESDKLRHYLVRGWEDERGRGASSVLLVTLVPYGKQWGAAVPAELDEKIAAALAGSDVGGRAVGESHVAVLDPAIAKLFDSGIAALKDSHCGEYYNNLMSPSFRKATAPAALKTLISQCDRSTAVRDRTRLTLEIAKGLRPQYEYSDTRAVFDVSNQGLPFDRFVVEQIDHRWYIAE
jgi:hypothetical protein